MFRPYATIITTVLAAVVLFGCRSVAVPSHEFNALKEENARLVSENTRLANENKTLDARAKAAEDRTVAAEFEARTASSGVFREKQAAEKLPSGFAANPETGGIVLEQEILFDTGSASLKPSAKDTLKRLVNEVLNSEEYRGYFVRVDGHSDATPVKNSAGANVDNWLLSARRAHAVMRALKDLGVAEERLFIVGQGPTVPVEQKTKSAKNRRVEIIVMKNKFTRGTR